MGRQREIDETAALNTSREQQSIAQGATEPKRASESAAVLVAFCFRFGLGRYLEARKLRS